MLAVLLFVVLYKHAERIAGPLKVNVKVYILIEQVPWFDSKIIRVYVVFLPL